MPMRYLSFLILLSCSLNQVFACVDILPSDPQKIQVPVMNTGQSGMGGITDFSSKNDDCTLDCQCVYNTKTSLWEVNVAPKQVCVFMRQCLNCKSTAKECEIRFRDLQSSSLYKKTFYANDRNKFKIQKCYRENLKTIKCEEISNLPSYNQVKPLHI